MKSRCVLWACIYAVLAYWFLLYPNVAFAARTVQGTITGTDGAPVVGALVEALDSDIGDDDFMGAAITDSNGRYVINYAGGHWDTAPHRITTWRPDIFIRVSVAVCGTFQPVGRSGTRNNQKLRDDLTINLTVDIQSTCRLIERTFLPDFCRGSCCEDDLLCIETSTRPFMGVFEQAASCGCIGVTPVQPLQIPISTMTIVITAVVAIAAVTLIWSRRRRKKG